MTQGYKSSSFLFAYWKDSEELPKVPFFSAIVHFSCYDTTKVIYQGLFWVPQKQEEREFLLRFLFM